MTRRSTSLTARITLNLIPNPAPDPKPHHNPNLNALTLNPHHDPNPHPLTRRSTSSRGDSMSSLMDDAVGRAVAPGRALANRLDTHT